MGLGTPVAKRLFDRTLVQRSEGSVLNIDGEYLKIVVNTEELMGLK
jgi:hypothetical protein